MKTALLVAFLVVLAVVYTHAMPEDAHRLRGESHNRQTSPASVPSTTPKSGSGGICWTSSKCLDNCRRKGFTSGHCFFFSCYCTGELI